MCYSLASLTRAAEMPPVAVCELGWGVPAASHGFARAMQKTVRSGRCLLFNWPVLVLSLALSPVAGLASRFSPPKGLPVKDP